MRNSKDGYSIHTAGSCAFRPLEMRYIIVHLSMFYAQ